MNEINLDRSKRYDLRVRRGATIKKTILVKDQAGDDFDLTGWSAELQVVVSPSDETPNLLFDESDGLSLSAGALSILKPHTIWDAKLRRREYYYYLWMTNPDGERELWLNGKFIINEGLTPETSGSATTIQLTTPSETITLVIGGNGGGSGAIDVHETDFTVVLSGGKTFGRFVNGQVVPAAGLTAKEVQLLAAIEYIPPAFASFGISGQSATVEVGTTISGSKPYVWVLNQNSGVVSLIDIYDVTAGVTLVSNTPNDGTQSANVIANQLNSNGATQQYKGIAHDSVGGSDIDSAIFTITARFLRFFGPSASTPSNSAAVRALPSSAFHNGATTFT